jgi:hypothetical protein
MARKRAGQTRAGQNVKLSIIVPRELHDQVELACARHGLSASALIRRLIAAGISDWVAPQGVPAGAPGHQEGGGAAVTLPLTQETLRALDAATTYWGLDRRAVVQLLLAESVGAFVERGREKYEQLRRLPAPSTRGEDEPEPA